MTYAINAIICGLASMIPLGIGLAFYMDDMRWLWLCAPIVLFLS
jgi:hypothetical protein